MVKASIPLHPNSPARGVADAAPGDGHWHPPTLHRRGDLTHLDATRAIVTQHPHNQLKISCAQNKIPPFDDKKFTLRKKIPNGVRWRVHLRELRASGFAGTMISAAIEKPSRLLIHGSIFIPADLQAEFRTISQANVHRNIPHTSQQQLNFIIGPLSHPHSCCRMLVTGLVEIGLTRSSSDFVTSKKSVCSKCVAYCTHLLFAPNPQWCHHKNFVLGRDDWSERG